MLLRDLMSDRSRDPNLKLETDILGVDCGNGLRSPPCTDFSPRSSWICDMLRNRMKIRPIITPERFHSMNYSRKGELVFLSCENVKNFYIIPTSKQSTDRRPFISRNITLIQYDPCKINTNARTLTTETIPRWQK